ncbi:MAG: methionine ABC transporter ATP-binding protein [Simkaniaceae bacterium]|nr:methionine ABC transporter ATP-binding protein [Simkaniaceae bacterium]
MPVFTLRSVSKRYGRGRGAVGALHDVRLSVYGGDIYGIVGFSGAGKSTLVRLLSGLLSPSSGSVLFHGEDLSTMTKRELALFRRRIGMVFQSFNLLSSRNVVGNIEYPLEIAGVVGEERKKKVATLISLVGLEGKEESYPSQLSGGQKQRVGIARALAVDPEVLLCDEATSALDPTTTREILALLQDIHDALGITMVLITHEPDVVKRICTKVAVLEGGRVVDDGSVEEMCSGKMHETTSRFLEHAFHDIPAELLRKGNSNRIFLKLRFIGNETRKPVIAEAVKRFAVYISILSGRIDRMRSQIIGNLLIELTGSAEEIERTLHYFSEKEVYYEVMKSDV